MAVIVVVNPKGGVGKSTLSTNIAAYLASQHQPVLLGDADRQQSSRLWLDLRPEQARPIGTWDIGADVISRPPRGSEHVVIDTPAGLEGWRLSDVLKLADRIVVPLQPSVFDIFATRSFLDQLAAHRASADTPVGIVGMRVDSRTKAAEQLQLFVESLDLPVLGMLRNTQNYLHLAAHGLSVFDVPPARVERDLEQWSGMCQWLDAA